ncbi:MAG TPA: SH3 domain-containing protein [Chloroflexia bacterium]|nr:SH3 domain-containing protein [Chloroflexia bacterium]
MSSIKPRERKCASCRFYEASPLWRKGWCRNPLLYDPQTNHLVEAESLACSRTFIDYWEARNGIRPPMIGDGAQGPRRVRRAPSIPMTATGPGGAPLRNGPATVASVQAAAQPRERGPQLSLVRPTPDAPPESVAETRPLAIIAPPAEAPAVPEVATPPVQVRDPAYEDERRTRTVLAGSVLVALAVAAGVFWRPPPAPVATILPPPTLAAVVPLVPTNTPRPAPTAVPTAVPTPAPLVLALGANVQVKGLNGGTLNVRQNPGLKGRVVGRFTSGTRGQIKAGPQTADGVEWWQITGWDKVGTLGWVSAKFIEPVR